MDLSGGQNRSGWLHIDCPQRKSVDSAEYLRVCELADLIAQSLMSMITADSIETSFKLTSPAQTERQRSLPERIGSALDDLLRLTGLRSSGFFILDSNGVGVELQVHRHRDGQVIPFPERTLSESPVDQRAMYGQLVTIRRDDGTAGHWLPPSCKLGICAAVKSSNDPMGTLWGYDRRSRRLTPREHHIFESVATRIGHLLEDAVLREESSVKARLSNEMAAASGNKPAEVIDDSFLDGAIDVSSRCLSCSELGGDMSDVIRNGEHAVVAVGDASGHNLPATIVMSNVRGALYALATDRNAQLSSEELMSRINDALYGTSQTHQFMTMMVGNLDAERRRFSFTNAGHPPLIYMRGDDITMIDSHGILLGVMDNAEYDSASVELSPGDVLACYTDGICEASDRVNRMFKPEGVAESVRRSRAGTAAQIRDAIWSDVDRHLDGVPCDDDRTVLVLKAND